MFDDLDDYRPHVGDLVTLPDVHHICRITRIHKTPIPYCEAEVRGVRFAVNLSTIQPHQEHTIA
ncbi:MAG: hypothetical protein A2Y38_25805 [Spirochaetes bacterium GWB1_59_5]|nr:MAG: hypothetical protein A2Y38_25805 [Spirochaetes bacterium GWB1_59_5]